MSEEIDSATIVVAVDGSEHADRALRWAAEEASLEHRRLVVVTAGEDPGSIPVDAAAVARRLHSDLSVETLCVAGDPRDALIDLAKQAHLLVIGSRGRGPLSSLLLGSVSAAVSAQAACPVVVCRPTTDESPARGILVGADGTPESVPVIEFAYQQASLRGLPLTVLHCFWDAIVVAKAIRSGRAWGPDDDNEDLRVVLAESVAGLRTRFPDVRVTLTLKHGLVDQALVSQGEPWDLIVVGRHPMTTPVRLFLGSIATTILERAHATVAVVPEALPSD
jgi:nucleotide-binding universal stress UspA family protein